MGLRRKESSRRGLREGRRSDSEIIFSTREYGRGAIEEEKCTLTLEAWEGGEKK